MALPGITKARERARAADAEVRRLEDRAESVRLDLVDKGAAGYSVTTEDRAEMNAAYDALKAAESKAERLWDEVAFMEET